MSIEACTYEHNPFGPELDKYWRRRYEYFSRFDDGIQTDAEGLYSVMPEEPALLQAERLVANSVLDAFCGIGGNAIAFARRGKRVIAVDLDKSRLKMAENNAAVYGVSQQITFIHADALEILSAPPQTDAVFLDPPWGGPQYRESRSFLLRDFHPDGRLLLHLSLGHYGEVGLRIPRSFNRDDLQAFCKEDEDCMEYRIEDDFSMARLVSHTVYFRSLPKDPVEHAPGTLDSYRPYGN